MTLTFKVVRATDQARLPCESDANPFSGSRDIAYTNEISHRQRQKQNLTPFTACGKNGNRVAYHCGSYLDIIACHAICHCIHNRRNVSLEDMIRCQLIGSPYYLIQCFCDGMGMYGAFVTLQMNFRQAASRVRTSSFLFAKSAATFSEARSCMTSRVL